MADTRDLKSLAKYLACGFESRSWHLPCASAAKKKTELNEIAKVTAIRIFVYLCNRVQRDFYAALMPC